MPLDHLVECSDEGLQLGGGEELHFVEEEYDSCFVLAGGFADGDQHSGEVLVELSGVGETFGRVDVKARGDRSFGGDTDTERLQDRGGPSCAFAPPGAGRAIPNSVFRARLAIRGPKGVFFVISASMVTHFRLSAASSKALSSTDFPTPRRPVMIIDCSV